MRYSIFVLTPASSTAAICRCAPYIAYGGAAVDANLTTPHALAYYRATDQIPRKIWGAIAAKDWKSKTDYPEIRVVRFREPYYSGALTHHNIANVDAPIYSLEKTLADAFRNPKLVDRSVAIESLKATLAEHKSTPAKLAKVTRAYGAWNQMSPYLEALTANG